MSAALANVPPPSCASSAANEAPSAYPAIMNGILGASRSAAAGSGPNPPLYASTAANSPACPSRPAAVMKSPDTAPPRSAIWTAEIGRPPHPRRRADAGAHRDPHRHLPRRHRPRGAEREREGEPHPELQRRHRIPLARAPEPVREEDGPAQHGRDRQDGAALLAEERLRRAPHQPGDARHLAIAGRGRRRDHGAHPRGRRSGRPPVVRGRAERAPSAPGRRRTRGRARRRRR